MKANFLETENNKENKPTGIPSDLPKPDRITMDKLVGELAKGKSMDKILRQ